MEPTLRDLFAGVMSVGLIVRYGAEGFHAEEAYELADKMLACREPEPEPEIEEAGIATLTKKPRKRNVR
jgi:hypothetical protein